MASLEKQDYKNFEVLFSDDISKDNSIDIAKKYKKNLNLKIVKGTTRTKYGSYNQMNSILRAFKKSSGKIILFLDSDDFFHKKKISKKIWPIFPPQSCISMKRDFFEEVFPQISFKKFFNIWFDFRVAFYSYFISKNFEILDKR